MSAPRQFLIIGYGDDGREVGRMIINAASAPIETVRINASMMLFDYCGFRGQSYEVHDLTTHAQLRRALEEVANGVPAIDEHGQFFHMHHDENGEELGPEFIDPAAIIQHLQGIAHRALSALALPPMEGRE